MRNTASRVAAELLALLSEPAMGCGASSGGSSYQPGEEDDQDDPKLRAYLKARGLDAVDMNNRAPRALRRCRLLGSLAVAA